MGSTLVLLFSISQLKRKEASTAKQLISMASVNAAAATARGRLRRAAILPAGSCASGECEAQRGGGYGQQPAVCVSA